ncbi:MAG: uroporphyrinogen-III C-methyltransferase [Candidatus Eremiobacteraeota bacterium]|nr:uroporphyrinogen-III C-methyltransferase [Candidatus Eremiobacteraeota bacterium]
MAENWRSSGRVSLVGAGPGDPGLLTLRGADALRDADVLLYDALAADAVVALAPARCERIFVGKRGGNHAMPQSQIETLMVERARDGKRVVRLKGGDPFVFGRGGEEAQALHAAGIRFDVVPGITSAIAAPAYAGIPLTHRNHNPAFTVVTGHEDSDKSLSTIDWDKLADRNRTLVLLMAMGNLREIATRLIERGLAGSTPAAVVENGTRPNQRTVVGTLETIADDARRAGLGAPAVAVIGEVVGLRDDIAWFDRDALFGRRVLVTRPAHQAGEFARALLARGAEPILAPTIAIEPPDEPQRAHRAIDELGEYAWVVFSSQNGVDAFFDRLDALDADTRYLGNTKVASVGSKTAARLRWRGVRADLVPDVFDSESIARLLVESVKPGERVLVFRAQEARDVLPRTLETAGIRTDVVAAYKTVFPEDRAFAQKVARADIVTFTSASTVSGFATLLGGDAYAIEALQGKAVACIGPIAEEAARAIGMHVDVVADVFTTEGLIDALEAHCTLRS